jgi:hypothetical protein
MGTVDMAAVAEIWRIEAAEACVNCCLMRVGAAKEECWTA